MQIKYTFSGHETFICKHFWLKKGYDFIKQGGKFSAENAVISLGVGKNMVSSIRYWLKAFGLTDEDVPQAIADFLLGEDGRDAFIEDIGTIWLLHYSLIKTGKASIYSLFFNEFIRKRRADSFTKAQLHEFLKLIGEEGTFLYNEKTITSDISTLVRNYLKPKKEKSNIEDNFVGLLIELDLIRKTEKYKTEFGDKADNSNKEESYEVVVDNKDDLPYQIVLFAILEQLKENKGNSISFNNLLNEKNSPGRIFILSAEGLFEKIEEITRNYSAIVYSETAGNKELQVKEPFNKFEILDAYYKSI